MADTTIKQLLEAGVHFGHQTQRWNPKMKKYIFGERNGIYIINLEITLEYLKKGIEYVRNLTAQGKEILFVGTKRQAQDCIREAAEACEMPFVNQRWLGGMLTNFETIRKSLGRLETIDRMEKDGSFQYITKKEVGSLKKEREKLEKNLCGIRTMKRIPAAIFVIDAKKEEIAIYEARKLGIPVVAVLDTNCDPDLVDYPFPGNDDAIRAIKLFCNVVAQSAREGRDSFKKVIADQEARKAKEADDELAAKAAAEAAEAVEGSEQAVDESAPLFPQETIVEDVEQKFAKTALTDEEKLAKLAKPKKPVRK